MIEQHDGEDTKIDCRGLFSAQFCQRECSHLKLVKPMLDRIMPLAPSPVSVIGYAEFSAMEDRLQKQREPTSEQGYEIWKRYDSSVRAVMRCHGKTVGWDAGVDFYHGGDWFHELYDGFALMTMTALSTQLLHDLQSVVALHHSDAVLSIGGEMDTPMTGLSVLVTPSVIYATWYKQSAATCRREIKKAGVQIL